MSDHSQVEHEISECWKIIDDLKVLTENIIEGNPTKDTITNILIGMEELYDMKFSKLYRTLQECIYTNREDAVRSQTMTPTNWTQMMAEEFHQMMENIDKNNDLNEYSFDTQVDWVDRVIKERDTF